MNIIPWRIRAAISNRFPLAYHFAANLIRKRAGENYWDKNLADGWGIDDRRWPTKLGIIAQRTKSDSAILDIACGNGSMLRGLRESGFNTLSGLEISRYAVKDLARKVSPCSRAYCLTSLSWTIASTRLLLPRFWSTSLDETVSLPRLPVSLNRGSLFFVPNDCLGPIDEPEHVIKYNHKTFEEFLTQHFDIVSIEVIKDANYAMSILMGHVRNRVKR